MKFALFALLIVGAAALDSVESNYRDPLQNIQDGAWYLSKHNGKCKGWSGFCNHMKIGASYVPGTRNGGGAQWLIFDFSTPKTISKVMIDHWGTKYWMHAPRDVSVQISNRIGGWKTCSQIRTKETCMPVYYQVTPCTGRSARLFLHNKHRNDSPFYVLDEVIFYGKKATAYPTAYPTNYPTAYPTAFPTAYPTAFPTNYPTAYPT